VPFTDNECSAIQHSAIERYLATKPAQTVTIGLDLVPMERTVYDRNVDSDLTTTEPQLLHERDVFLAFVTSSEPRQQRLANRPISWNRGTAQHRTEQPARVNMTVDDIEGTRIVNL
jgi:hypothetical protein